MNADEKAIIEYLRGWPFSFLSAKEISRKVGGRKRCEKEPGWALPTLAKMVREGTLETDDLGHFKLGQKGEKKKRIAKFVSPQMLRILKSSGKNFEGIVIDEDEEEEKKEESDSEPKSKDKESSGDKKP